MPLPLTGVVVVVFFEFPHAKTPRRQVFSDDIMKDGGSRMKSPRRALINCIREVPQLDQFREKC